MVVLFGASALVGGYQNCTRVNFATVASPAELKVVSAEGNPFTTPPAPPPKFDANSEVSGVVAADGNPSENLRVSTVEEASANYVVDCSTPGLAEVERQAALAAAAADPNHMTIPVQFAISFGTKEDTLAYWAHSRAILSVSNPGESYIPVGGAETSVLYDDGKAKSAYYVVDNGMGPGVGAYNDYRYGKKCFYDTVTVKSHADGSPQLVEENQTNQDGSESIYAFITQKEDGTGIRHKIKYMWYGYCAPSAAGQEGCSQAGVAAYGNGKYNYGNDVYPNRLFGKLPHTEKNDLTGLEEPQIVKLYVADLRDGQIRGKEIKNAVISIPTELNRGDEVAMDPKKFLDLRTIFRNRDQIIVNLSSDYTSATGYLFQGMSGVPQVLGNIIVSGADGTDLASQYTPIVLDLGKPGVMTSSLMGGTYFNMAGAYDPKNTEPSTYDQPHQTAWLGGELQDVMASSEDSTDEGAFKHDFRRVVEDGFLVMADEDGQVRSSRNMFGNETVVNGVSYKNGFLALQALSGKDCTSDNPKNRYFGPWDGDLYTTKVQVWVDANRNGAVDDGELMSLKTAGVVAINACNIVSAQATDTFGNGTSLRSAFLRQSGEDITGDEQEILNRINTGKTKQGDLADFRLAIDLLFQVNTGHNLFSSPDVVIPSTTDERDSVMRVGSN